MYEQQQTLIYLASILVELNPSSVFQPRFKSPNILDIILARPIQRPVAMVSIILKTPSEELLLHHFVPFWFEVQNSLVVPLTCKTIVREVATYRFITSQNSTCSICFPYVSFCCFIL